MSKLNLLKKWIPEIYLLASAVFYWVSTTLLNPFAVCLVAVLLILFIKKTKTLGVIVSLLFLFLSLYMVLALLSEVNEFPSFNTRAKQLLGFGGAWLGLNVTLAFVMLVKWGKDHSFADASISTTAENAAI